jgi:tetratricopeptide (TPR) repeat protein
MALCDYEHYEEALEYLLKSAEMDPTEWTTKISLGWLYFCQEEWKKAVELSEQTESILQKLLEEEPEKTNDLETHLHTLQERIGDCYEGLQDKKRRYAAYKRALVNNPGCSPCLATLFFHNNDEERYEDTIELLKDLQSQRIHGKDYSRLSTMLWEVSFSDNEFHYIISAALETGRGDFLVEAYRDSIKAARKESHNIIASWLELALAKFYQDIVGDEKKAVHLYEKNLQTLAASKEEGEVGYLKRAAAVALATTSMLHAVDAGINSPEATKYTRRLERIVKKTTSSTSTKDVEAWIPASAPALILGAWYRMCGREEDAHAYLRPSIKQAIQILSDDDPENDAEGFIGLQNAFTMAGDDANTIAIAYHIGVYDDADTETSEYKGGGETGEGAEDKKVNHTTDGEDKDGFTLCEIDDDDIRITCEGPCRKESKVHDLFYFCRYCYDASFEENCFKLLKDGLLPFNRSSQKHADDMMFIPPRPQKLESGKMLVEGKVIDFEEWKNGIKKQWNV